MIRSIKTFALLISLAATGYSQQAIRDDGFRPVDQYVPWTLPIDTTYKMPMRYFYGAGDPIPEQELEVIYIKDCDVNGWKYLNQEWEELMGAVHSFPEYYYDEARQQDNGGYSIG